jgi:ABC-type nitrate/sulfonate/bicarbonate transport system ATPase subunit
MMNNYHGCIQDKPEAVMTNEIAQVFQQQALMPWKNSTG